MFAERHKSAKSFAEFQQEFQASGLPDSLIQSIDRVVNALNTGSKINNGPEPAKAPSSDRRDVFKSLAIPDTAPDAAMDGLMADLEQAAPLSKRHERDDRYYEGRRRRERSPRQERYNHDRKRRRSPEYDHRRHRRDRYDEPIPARMPAIPPAPIANGSHGRNRRERKRLTSPERFEIAQLIASGVAKAGDYEGYNVEYEATNGAPGFTAEEEDPDIEVKDDEPPFLKGQTQHDTLSPVRIIRAPEVSIFQLCLMV